MEEEVNFRRWTVPVPDAVFLLVHGIGAYSGRWEAMAGFFLRNNISSYAIDCPDPENYCGSILRLRDKIAEECPAKKIFLVGESLGGIRSFLIAVRRPELFDGLVCLSPAFKSRLRLTAMEYLCILAALFYDPKKQFSLPFNSSMCTRDKDYSNAMDADIHERRRSSARSLAETVFLQTRANLEGRALKMPAIFLVAGDDRIVDPAVSAKVFKRLKIKDKTFIEYPGMYHSLSVELGKEKVFEDLLKWARDRI